MLNYTRLDVGIKYSRKSFFVKIFFGKIGVCYHHQYLTV